MRQKGRQMEATSETLILVAYAYLANGDSIAYSPQHFAQSGAVRAWPIVKDTPSPCPPIFAICIDQK